MKDGVIYVIYLMSPQMLSFYRRGISLMVHFESLEWVRVHQAGLQCFDLQWRSYLILNNVFQWKVLSNKTKNYRENWVCSWYWWKNLSEWDLMKVIWICLHLRCGRYCILSNFVIELQLNYKKWFWKKTISGVACSHLG
jgi:hypothetical protein